MERPGQLAFPFWQSLTGPCLSHYQAGQHIEAWAEMVARAEAVRQREARGDAYAVARDTMRRVRRNVEAIHQRLLTLGYRFANPAKAFVPPEDDARAAIEFVEYCVGYLPMSLQAFYEEVGSVDFRQSTDQLIQYRDTRRSEALEVQILGEEDPLVVFSLSELRAEAAAAGHKLYFCFAPDEFHKANYSGGENYHVWLPDASAEFQIQGMYDMDEYFVDYLRATIGYGGFRGRGIIGHDGNVQKTPPLLGLISELARDLEPF